MYISLFIWVILITIGVSDAKAHRIPNKLLMLLLGIFLLGMFMRMPQEALWPVLLDKSAAFGIAFVFALVLHLARVMAPGDVKLIAVLGFYLGTDELVHYLYYVCLITAFVGAMYWLLNRLYVEQQSEINEQASAISFTGIAVNLQLSKEALKTKVTTGKDLTYMPFAPILVMGLALHQYYS
ncbi:prepilin peptidase [Vibrio alginolyticus]